MQVSVVIPVYKPELTKSEKAALLQCKQVLGSYPIQLIAPETLDLTLYFELLQKEVQVKRFNDTYFKSVQGYSRLLLSRFFYKEFLEYDYILIYQLDAWVFSDQLKYWVETGYTYIGAPWLESPPLPEGKKIRFNLSKYLKNKVGNGGFSLRHVHTHYAWASWTRFVFRLLPKNEDIIWALFTRLKKPTVEEALRFAFEMQPSRSFSHTKGSLPFGCHAWEKYEPEFWSHFIDLEISNG